MTRSKICPLSAHMAIATRLGLPRMQDSPIRRTWCLVHARGKALNPAAERMKAFVTERLGTLAGLLDDDPFP